MCSWSQTPLFHNSSHNTRPLQIMNILSFEVLMTGCKSWSSALSPCGLVDGYRCFFIQKSTISTKTLSA
jgi:hypothetical protein